MSNQEAQRKKKRKVIGDYQIGHKIGTGTFASVRQGIHIPTNQKVAIKILNKNIIEQTKDKVNLSRQIRILKKIRHPNISQLLQIMQTSTRIYFVMEYIEGGELFTRITSSNKGRLNESEAVIIFQQLLNAIQYLHKIGIAHRDIKPENILLDAKGNVKLIDFGLSTFYQTNKKLKTSCGSPCYAAPEMLVEQLYNPLLSDIWSCGIVLYAIICGFLPFEEKSTKVLYEKIKIGFYEQPKFMSESSKSLIKKILKFIPEERLSINEIRKHSFCSPKQAIISGLLPTQPLKLQESIILEMNKLGYYGFRSDVENHKNASSTAAYFLLLYKKLRTNSQSLLTYFNSLTDDLNANSLNRSKSMFYKKSQSMSNRNKNEPEIIANEQQGNFLDKLIKKNMKKMRERSLSIRIRKITT